nr:immunoglobulin light chain junction region [Macaca mulatta]MOV72569.1 immunoglobulin light chain junction region [Macaca mulatta]MOV72744.1 immunoglobulin light chain junction region [Macaca mulatta]MOV73214.1 immunoglobulin light chain junction region [Macaca mulatta]MOV74194.1 immunoglobulin light chain junction region [Macaca mulatta]
DYYCGAWDSSLSGRLF